MYTIGDITRKIVDREESYSINIGAVGKVALPVSTVVKLDATTGEVEPVASKDDKPFGVVTAGSRKDGEAVTIQTFFQGIYRAKASGALAIGDEVSAEALDGDVVKYIKSDANVIGVALSEGADGEDVQVGVYRTFRK